MQNYKKELEEKRIRRMSTACKILKDAGINFTTPSAYQINAKDDYGDIQTYYPTSYKIVLHYGVNPKNPNYPMIRTLTSKSILDFIYYLRHPDIISKFFQEEK